MTVCATEAKSRNTVLTASRGKPIVANINDDVIFRYIKEIHQNKTTRTAITEGLLQGKQEEDDEEEVGGGGERKDEDDDEDDEKEEEEEEEEEEECHGNDNVLCC